VTLDVMTDVKKQPTILYEVLGSIVMAYHVAIAAPMQKNTNAAVNMRWRMMSDAYARRERDLVRAGIGMPKLPPAWYMEAAPRGLSIVLLFMSVFLG